MERPVAVLPHDRVVIPPFVVAVGRVFAGFLRFFVLQGLRFGQNLFFHDQNELATGFRLVFRFGRGRNHAKTGHSGCQNRVWAL